MAKKLKVLFLCPGNSCRSQMAEGWTQHLKGDVIESYSAGIETHGLNPLGVKVMSEAGVDISGQRSTNMTSIAVNVSNIVGLFSGANAFFPEAGESESSGRQEGESNRKDGILNRPVASKQRNHRRRLPTHAERCGLLPAHGYKKASHVSNYNYQPATAHST